MLKAENQTRTPTLKASIFIMYKGHIRLYMLIDLCHSFFLILLFDKGSGEVGIREVVVSLEPLNEFPADER